MRKRFRHWLLGPQPPRMTAEQYEKHFGDGKMDLGAGGTRVPIAAVEAEFKADMLAWDHWGEYEFPESALENEMEKRK